jgi:hypothetical protein
MMLHEAAVTAVATGMQTAGIGAGVCPAPPTGMQTYTDLALSWVKFTVLALMGIAFFGSVGMLVWGRVTHHPKGARLGFDGMLICFVGALLYVIGFPVISGITGSGC